jgi:hypothetical protein
MVMDKVLKKQIRESLVEGLSHRQMLVRTEIARILCAIYGTAVSEGLTASQVQDSKIQAQLTLAKEQTLAMLQSKANRKKQANRKQYIKARTKVLQELYKDQPEVLAREIAKLANPEPQSVNVSTNIPQEPKEPKEPENELLENMLAALGEKSYGQ